MQRTESLRKTVCAVAMAGISVWTTPTSTSAAQTPQFADLRIVVIQGEDAVNVIQQKSAVAPIVEVRDRNDQPVAGAVVRFAIQGGRASFGGARTLTVTTNIAGRAAVTSLTPASSGAFQITASAAFQGQTAVATIAQTNVLTAAQAAGAAGASGAGGTGGGAGAGASGGAAGGGAGGGLSATTIGIVGGAVAGGALAAKEVVGGGGTSIYEGEFRIDVLQTSRQVRGNGTVFSSCVSTISFTGEVRGEIDEQESGTLTGTISANGYYRELSTTCPPSAPGPVNEHISFGSGAVIGTTAAFQANGQNQSMDSLLFSGALHDGMITGTFTLLPSLYRSSPDASGGFGETTGSGGSTQVTLTK